MPTKANPGAGNAGAQKISQTQRGINSQTKPAAQARPVYVIRLRPLPGVDAVRNLRHALKRLRRAYGLECASIVREPPE